MLQNPCKTLGFKKNMVYKIPPGGEVNHIQPVAYVYIILKLSMILFFSCLLSICSAEILTRRSKSYLINKISMRNITSMERVIPFSGDQIIIIESPHQITKGLPVPFTWKLVCV